MCLPRCADHASLTPITGVPSDSRSAIGESRAGPHLLPPASSPAGVLEQPAVPFWVSNATKKVSTLSWIYFKALINHRSTDVSSSRPNQSNTRPFPCLRLFRHRMGRARGQALELAPVLALEGLHLRRRPPYMAWSAPEEVVEGEPEERGPLVRQVPPPRHHPPSLMILTPLRRRRRFLRT
jgi:hypothetical protein